MDIHITVKQLELALVVLTTCYFLFKGIDSSSASFLLSIIGITNTFGRVVVGYVADFPRVNALLMNNICLVVSTVVVAATPFCSSYAAYIAMSVFFGIAVCKYTDNISCVFLNFMIIFF
jgi:predicted MFS family arabinose efflux permease